MKSKDLKIEPLRTPNEAGTMSDKSCPILIAYHLSIMKKMNSILPEMHIDKRLTRISWSVMSNAADRSSRVSAVTLPLSRLRLMSLCIFKSVIVWMQTMKHWIS